MADRLHVNSSLYGDCVCVLFAMGIVIGAVYVIDVEVL